MTDQPFESINYDELLLSLSHELRSPLSNICTFAEMILAAAQVAQNHQIEEDAQRIEVQARRVLNAVDAILELMRIGNLQPQYIRIALSHAIEEALTHVRETAKAAKCVLASHVPLDLPPVEIDAVAIAQVVTILLNQAIQFAEQDIVSVSAYAEDASVVVRISNGTMPTKEPEYQIALPTKRIKGALGVELLICQQLIRLHNGHFWVSRPADGQNICLNFSIPYHPNSEQ
jgi:K+-sensing histidine kinase KdpD